MKRNARKTCGGIRSASRFSLCLKTTKQEWSGFNTTVFVEMVSRTPSQYSMIRWKISHLGSEQQNNSPTPAPIMSVIHIFPHLFFFFFLFFCVPISHFFFPSPFIYRHHKTQSSLVLYFCIILLIQNIHFNCRETNKIKIINDSLILTERSVINTDRIIKSPFLDGLTPTDFWHQQWWKLLK